MLENGQPTADGQKGEQCRRREQLLGRVWFEQSDALKARHIEMETGQMGVCLLADQRCQRTHFA
jgi:hypothetical protein